MKRVLSSMLLLAGLALVFGGLSSALGFSTSGVVASVAAIVALLYAGAVWFGAPQAPPAPSGPGEPVLVFDRTFRVISGTRRGTPLVAQFPDGMRAEISVHCAAALSGQPAHFTCDFGNGSVGFDVAPVRASDGAVLCGILISAAAGPCEV